MVATNAPVPGHHAPGQSEPAQAEVGFSDAFRSAQRAKCREHRDGRRRDPSPAEIAEACQEIQRGWTWQERRMRAGARPLSDAQRKRGDREFERYGDVTGWTPPICRTSAGMGVTL